MFLSRFRKLNPPYLVRQQDAIAWLSEAHARRHPELSAESFAKLIQRYGCGPERIATRATFARDFTHRRWDEMQLFSAASTDLGSRMAFFDEVLLPEIETLYAEDEPDFEHWLHVTCSGYLSPSVVQKMVSRRAWGGRVQCLHAYHMGCYAALPALRMARGNGECDILHTELCTLHLDPAKHEPEQLVIQSLFADGVIRYRAGEARPAIGFKVEAMREVVVPDSLRHMTWALSAEGFVMTLDREVPRAVEKSIAALIQPWQSKNCLYAVHPGGPRIIEAVGAALGLSAEQLHFSHEILRHHGNMSSATLPHVWQRMLPEIPVGTPVISMAFGPGLTLSASHMVKVAT